MATHRERDKLFASLAATDGAAGRISVAELRIALRRIVKGYSPKTAELLIREALDDDGIQKSENPLAPESQIS